MGIYDENIKKQRTEIRQIQAEIKQLQKEIKELQEMRSKAKCIDKKIADSLNGIYADIKKRENDTNKEFMDWYLGNLKEIARKNHMNDTAAKTQEDDKKIAEKIENKEKQIRSLRNRISQCEQQISYYNANNTEIDAEGEKQ